MVNSREIRLLVSRINLTNLADGASLRPRLSALPSVYVQVHISSRPTFFEKPL